MPEPYRGDLRAPERARVAAGVAQVAHELVDGVGAREDRPAVAGRPQIVDRSRNRPRVEGPRDLDRRQLDRLRALRRQQRARVRSPAGACASPARACRTAAAHRTSAGRRADAPPRRRSVTAGAPMPASATAAAIVSSVAVTTRWRGSVPHSTTATGVDAARPCSIRRCAISAQAPDAHQEDERVDARREMRPVDAGVVLRGIFVAGDDGERRREPAVRHRDARVRGRGDGRRDAGDDLERDAGGGQRLRLLAAAAEDERVAALQPHDALARARPARRAAR